MISIGTPKSAENLTSDAFTERGGSYDQNIGFTPNVHSDPLLTPSYPHFACRLLRGASRHWRRPGRCNYINAGGIGFRRAHMDPNSMDTNLTKKIPSCQPTYVGDCGEISRVNESSIKHRRKTYCWKAEHKCGNWSQNPKNRIISLRCCGVNKVL